MKESAQKINYSVKGAIPSKFGGYNFNPIEQQDFSNTLSYLSPKNDSYNIMANLPLPGKIQHTTEVTPQVMSEVPYTAPIETQPSLESIASDTRSSMKPVNVSIPGFSDISQKVKAYAGTASDLGKKAVDSAKTYADKAGDVLKNYIPSKDDLVTLGKATALATVVTMLTPLVAGTEPKPGDINPASTQEVAKEVYQEKQANPIQETYDLAFNQNTTPTQIKSQPLVVENNKILIAQVETPQTLGDKTGDYKRQKNSENKIFQKPWDYTTLLKDKGQSGKNFTLSSTEGYVSKDKTVDRKSVAHLITEDGTRYKVERGIGVRNGLNFHREDTTIDSLATDLSRADIIDGERIVVGFYDSQSPTNQYHSASFNLPKDTTDKEPKMGFNFSFIGKEGFKNFDPSDKWQIMVKDNKDTEGNNDAIIASITSDLKGLNVNYGPSNKTIGEPSNSSPGKKIDTTTKIIPPAGETNGTGVIGENITGEKVLDPNNLIKYAGDILGFLSYGETPSTLYKKGEEGVKKIIQVNQVQGLDNIDWRLDTASEIKTFVSNFDRSFKHLEGGNLSQNLSQSVLADYNNFYTFMKTELDAYDGISNDNLCHSIPLTDTNLEHLYAQMFHGIESPLDVTSGQIEEAKKQSSLNGISHMLMNKGEFVRLNDGSIFVYGEEKQRELENNPTQESKENNDDYDEIV